MKNRNIILKETGQSYEISDIKIIGHSYKTNDGKYFTKADGQGYSYWYEEEFRLGNTAYDYLFFVGEKGFEGAVKVLNRVISNN